MGCMHWVGVCVLRWCRGVRCPGLDRSFPKPIARTHTQDVLTSATRTWSERQELLRSWSEAPEARYCHPREEHLLPLMVAFGAGGPGGEGGREGVGGAGRCVFSDVMLNAVASSFQFD
jgi:aromatic ring-opening dioxygenase catalytic subunit (LigB family)